MIEVTSSERLSRIGTQSWSSAGRRGDGCGAVIGGVWAVLAFLSDRTGSYEAQWAGGTSGEHKEGDGAGDAAAGCPELAPTVLAGGAGWVAAV